MRKSLLLAFVLSCLAIAPLQAEEKSWTWNEDENHILDVAVTMSVAQHYCPTIRFSRELQQWYHIQIAERAQVPISGVRLAIQSLGDDLERAHLRREITDLCERACRIHARYRALYRLPSTGCRVP